MKIKLAILLILTALIISGCFKDRIDIELEEENKEQVIITAWLTNTDQAQFVSVTKMQGYLGDKPPEGISNAEVSISDGQETLQLVEQENGTYHLPEGWKAEVGLTYELTVSHNNKLYTASHYTHKCPEIEDLQIRKLIDFEGTDSSRIYLLSFSFVDFDGEGDAYYGVEYVRGGRDSIKFSDGEFTDDRFIDGEIFEDVVLTDDDRMYQLGDTAVLELHSIGAATSMYLQDIINEIFRDGPFDAPPANVRTNFSGGALGYFITSDTKVVEILIKE